MIYASIIVFLLTLAISTCKNGGLPVCLSDCYYIIGKWFTLSMWAVAGTMTVPMMQQTPEEYYFLVFATVAGIYFVGAAAMYKDTSTYPLHKYAAFISALSSTIWVILINPFYLLCDLSALIALYDQKRWLLWIEIACFSTVFFTTLNIQ